VVVVDAVAEDAKEMTEEDRAVLGMSSEAKGEVGVLEVGGVAVDVPPPRAVELLRAQGLGKGSVLGARPLAACGGWSNAAKGFLAASSFLLEPDVKPLAKLPSKLSSMGDSTSLYILFKKFMPPGIASTLLSARSCCRMSSAIMLGSRAACKVLRIKAGSNIACAISGLDSISCR